MTRRRMRRRARAGFTLLEVMLALAVLLIGVMGIIALQRATIHANYDARTTSVATVNQARWSSILRRSALLWTDAGGSTIGVPYLNQIGAGWFIPQPNNGATDAYGMNWYGRPTDVAADVRFCTLIQLQWLSPNQSMRAEIITFWARQGRTANTAGAQLFGEYCDPASPSTAAAALNADTPTTVADLHIREVRTAIVLRRSMP